jgi:hypothetical protein
MTKGSFAYKFFRLIRFCSLCTSSLNMNIRFVKMGLYKKPPFRPMGAIEPPLLPYCVWKGVKFTPLAQLVGRRKGDRLPPKAGERVF